MITMQMLRERVTETNAWGEIADVLEINISPDALAESANDEIIFEAYAEGSIKSEKLRDKLHRHPFPDISKFGIYSDNDMIYTIGGGLKTAIEITSKAEKHKHPFESALKVLDFGCGTSRILRYLVEFLPGPQYYGSEVFQKNIEWGRSAFPEVTYLHHDNSSTIDMPDNSFDIIYAYSIFSHFEENIHRQWLSELCRLLKKSGLIILTVHGKTILDRCKYEESVIASMCIADKNYEDLYDKFINHGYVFYSCYDSQHLSKGGLNSEIFGITYISAIYIRKPSPDYYLIFKQRSSHSCRV